MKFLVLSLFLVPMFASAADLTKFYGIEVNGSEKAFLSAVQASGASIYELDSNNVIVTPGKFKGAAADKLKLGKHCLKSKYVSVAWQYICSVELGPKKDTFGLFVPVFDGKLQRLNASPLSNAPEVSEATKKTWDLKESDEIEVNNSHLMLMQTWAKGVCTNLGGCKVIIKEIGSDIHAAFVLHKEKKKKDIVLELQFTSKSVTEAFRKKFEETNQ